MRKLVRTVKAMKTMVVVDVTRHVGKHVVDVVRTLKQVNLCALSLLSQAISRTALARFAENSSGAPCYAWALVPACQGRWQRPESRWGWSRPPQS